MIQPPVPEKSYGVLQRDSFPDDVQEICEEIRRVGYAVLDSGMTPEQVAGTSGEFDRAYDHYASQWGREYLESIDEHNTMRAPLLAGSQLFERLPFNPRLLQVLRELIAGRFILNQQNAIINPAGQTYNQAAWHRDLPYQHFLSSAPLAINALFCVDDFTIENGATFVLPGSHKSARFPSESFVRKHAIQIPAKAGQYIVLDCMLFHSGGFNSTRRNRRAVNHVFTIPYFKQQIHLPCNVNASRFTPEELDILGADLQEPATIHDYLLGRRQKLLRQAD